MRHDKDCTSATTSSPARTYTAWSLDCKMMSAQLAFAAGMALPCRARAFVGDPLCAPAIPRVTSRAVRAARWRANYLDALASPTDRTLAKPGRPLVPVLMGSAADLPFCRKIVAALDALGIESTMRIASAHKVPATLLALLERWEESDRPVVYIAVAGRSNALSGVLDCAVQSPVVSCPPPSDAFGGADLFSSIRMPSGVAPALVLEPANAALMAAKIFALSDSTIRTAVATLQRRNRDTLAEADAKEVAANGGEVF